MQIRTRSIEKNNNSDYTHLHIGYAYHAHTNSYIVLQTFVKSSLNSLSIFVPSGSLSPIAMKSCEFSTVSNFGFNPFFKLASSCYKQMTRAWSQCNWERTCSLRAFLLAPSSFRRKQQPSKSYENVKTKAYLLPVNCKRFLICKVLWYLIHLNSCSSLSPWIENSSIKVNTMKNILCEDHKHTWELVSAVLCKPKLVDGCTCIGECDSADTKQLSCDNPEGPDELSFDKLDFRVVDDAKDYNKPTRTNNQIPAIKFLPQLMWKLNLVHLNQPLPVM